MFINKKSYSARPVGSKTKAVKLKKEARKAGWKHVAIRKQLGDTFYWVIGRKYKTKRRR